jgi:hypothetical protein
MPRWSRRTNIDVTVTRVWGTAFAHLRRVHPASNGEAALAPPIGAFRDKRGQPSRQVLLGNVTRGGSARRRRHESVSLYVEYGHGSRGPHRARATARSSVDSDQSHAFEVSICPAEAAGPFAMSLAAWTSTASSSESSARLSSRSMITRTTSLRVDRSAAARASSPACSVSDR